MAAAGGLTTWFKRLVLLATAVLLCVLSVFMWRLSVLVQRLDQSVEALSSKVDKASQVASQAGELLDPRRVLDELRSEETASDASATAGEIAHLMDRIGQLELSYIYGDDSRSAAWVQTKLWIKYQTFRSQIGSAEDFIQKVASRTMDNEVYYVVQKNGEKEELSVFLTEALQSHRSTGSDLQ